MSLVLVPIAFAIWLKYQYRQIHFLFILLFAVGITQGLCENLAFFAMGEAVVDWGQMKGAMIAMVLVATMLNPKSLKRPLSTSLLVWSVAYLFILLVLTGQIFEAINNGQKINAINTFQNFGMINMVMVYIIFFNYEEKLVDVVIDMIVKTGQIVSVIAIMQWLAFKYFEIDTRLLMAAKGFGSLDVDDGQAIRVFSVFASHYGLSAFLTLVTILYFSRWLFDRRAFGLLPLVLFVIAHSLTFNLTGIVLTVAGCGVAWLLFLREKAIKLSIVRFARYILGIGLLASLLMLNEAFYTRLAGIFEYSSTASGAGGSLYQRAAFIGNGINLLWTNPLGVGLSLTDLSLSDYIDLGYVRIGHPAQPTSADAYFLWLIVQIGLLFGVVMLLLYILPLARGVALTRVVDASYKAQGAAFSAIIFVILIGALSNSPILTYPPSNILLWCAVGALFAMRNARRDLVEPPSKLQAKNRA